MRIVQFRRHLTGYAVRVTDSKDIASLSRRKQFVQLMVVKQVSSAGKREKLTVISAEYLCPTPKLEFDDWKKHVWGILKYRRYRGK